MEQKERIAIYIDGGNFHHLVLKKLGIQKIEFQRMREKGIDVKLATDLIVGAVDDQYDTAIVVSSDADIVPAIDWIRYRFKKKIEYIGFSIIDASPEQNHTKPLQTLIGHSDVQRVFGASDLKSFVRPFVQGISV